MKQLLRRAKYLARKEDWQQLVMEGLACEQCHGTGEDQKVGSQICNSCKGKRIKKGMIDVEMVDCVIRIFDFLGQKGVDVERIFRDKMEFNKVREDHKLESRMKEGGKKY